MGHAESALFGNGERMGHYDVVGGDAPSSAAGARIFNAKNAIQPQYLRPQDHSRVVRRGNRNASPPELPPACRLDARRESLRPPSL